MRGNEYPVARLPNGRERTFQIPMRGNELGLVVSACFAEECSKSP